MKHCRLPCYNKLNTFHHKLPRNFSCRYTSRGKKINGDPIAWLAMETGLGKARSIVVAVDESEESMNALSWCLSKLVSQGNPNDATLVLLYVKPPPPIYSFFDAAEYLLSGDDAVVAMQKHETEMVHSVMERAEAVYRSFNTRIKLERVVGKGDVKDVICHTVKKLKADTLVMGSHGYGFMKRALLGSVSEHCAKNVKCPVVIVKH